MGAGLLQTLFSELFKSKTESVNGVFKTVSGKYFVPNQCLWIFIFQVMFSCRNYSKLAAGS